MGKYLTNFKTKEEYEAFKAGGSYLTPNVSFIETAGSVINDSYQVPTSGEGGSVGSLEYFDLTNVEQNVRDAFNEVAFVKKIGENGSGAIGVASRLYVDDNRRYLVKAVATDFSGTFYGEFMPGVGGSYTVLECLVNDFGLTEEQIAAVPRLTKEQFYSLHIA